MTRGKIGMQTGVIVHGKGINVADYVMLATLVGKVCVRHRGYTAIHERRSIESLKK